MSGGRRRSDDAGADGDPPRPRPRRLLSTGATSKLWYLWTYSAQATLVPFLNLAFLRRGGLTQRELGVVSAARPWLSAVAGNLWALLADATGKHLLILTFAYVSCGLLRYSLRYVRGFAATLAVVLLMEAVGSPVNIIADSAVIKSGRSEGDYGRTRLFGAVGWGLFSPVGGWLVQRRGLDAGFVANGIGWGTGLALTLLLPVGVLSSPPTTAKEGERRSPAADEDGGGDEDELAAEAAEREPPPLVAAPELVSFDGPHLLLHEDESEGSAAGKRRRRRKKKRSTGRGDDVERPLLSASASDDAEEAASTSSRVENENVASTSTTERRQEASLPLSKKLSAIFTSSPRAIPFFATAVLFGFAMGTVDTWLFVFLSELGASETLMGSTLTVTCVVEAPVFYASGALIRALGVPRILDLVHLCFLLRLGCYWLLPWAVAPTARGGLGLSPWCVLAAEGLHGVTFGCAWAAGCAQAARLAPPGLSATTQAVFSGLYLGAGSGLGSLVGGIVHSRVRGGGRAVFGVCWLVVAGGWALSTVANWCLSEGEEEEAGEEEGRRD